MIRAGCPSLQAPWSEDDIRDYAASDVCYPKRYKVRPRIYFIVIKTAAATMQDFKDKKALRSSAPAERQENPVMLNLTQELAGKTTLEWEFLKATNFKHVVIDRGPMGYMTFDKLFDRETKLGNQEFIHQARKIMKSKDFMVVYCFASEDVAARRLKEHNEECPYNYKEAQ